jgi:hypothetical protein
MKKLVLLLILLQNLLTIAQQAVSASGGTFSGNSGSFSCTVGQMFYGYSKNASHSLTAGVQQTYSQGSLAVIIPAAVPSELFNAMAYPNPSSTAFEVTTNTEKAFGVQIYDLLGRLIEKQFNQETTMKIGANYQSGTYILRVSQGENQKTLQVIKK